MVNSSLDCCKSILAEMSNVNFNQLERVPYTLARANMSHMPATIWHQFSPSCIGWSSIIRNRHDDVHNPSDKAAILPGGTDRGCCSIQDLPVIHMSARHADRVKNRWSLVLELYVILQPNVELSATQCYKADARHSDPI